MRGGRRQTDRVQVIDRGSEPDICGNRGCARFKLIRQRRKRSLFKTHGTYHSSARLIRWHFIQPFPLPINDSASRWGKHLVSGKREKIAVQILDIDWKMRNALSSIDKN